MAVLGESAAFQEITHLLTLVSQTKCSKCRNSENFSNDNIAPCQCLCSTVSCCILTFEIKGNSVPVSAIWHSSERDI